MGYSAWLMRKRWSLLTQALYYSQLLLNLAWQPAFFNFHKLTTALNIIGGAHIVQSSSCHRSCCISTGAIAPREVACLSSVSLAWPCCCAVLDVLVVLLTIAFSQKSKRAALCLIPYLGWILLATALNASIRDMNPR